MRIVPPFVLIVLFLASCGGDKPKPEKLETEELEQEIQKRTVDKLAPTIASYGLTLGKSRAAAASKATGDPEVGKEMLREHARELVEMMKDQDSEKRAMTAEMVRQLTGQKFGNSYEAWRKWFDETDPKTPGDRARALVRRLATRTGDQEGILKELATIGEPAIGPLAEAVKGPDYTLRMMAAYALRRIQSPKVIPALVALVLKGPPDAGKPATHALLSKEAPEAYPMIVSMLQSPERRARDLAQHILNLGEWKSAPDPKNIPALVATLGHEDESSRRVALVLLERIKSREAYKALVEALSSKFSDVRRRAMTTLGELTGAYPEKRAIVAGLLIEHLADKDASMADSAVKVLQKMTGQSFGKDPAAWRKWFEREKGR